MGNGSCCMNPCQKKQVIKKAELNVESLLKNINSLNHEPSIFNVNKKSSQSKQNSLVPKKHLKMLSPQRQQCANNINCFRERTYPYRAKKQYNDNNIIYNSSNSPKKTRLVKKNRSNTCKNSGELVNYFRYVDSVNTIKSENSRNLIPESPEWGISSRN